MKKEIDGCKSSYDIYLTEEKINNQENRKKYYNKAFRAST